MIMFKLPVCPYCNTVYSYKDVKNNRNKKEIECYHCKNKFKQRKIIGFSVLAAILLVIAVVFNLIILNLTAEFITSIIPLMAVSLIAVLLFMIINPFFTEYKKTNSKDIKKIPKNRF